MRGQLRAIVCGVVAVVIVVTWVAEPPGTAAAVGLAVVFVVMVLTVVRELKRTR
jgi:Flp pilus assembly protein TadB